MATRMNEGYLSTLNNQFFAMPIVFSTQIETSSAVAPLKIFHSQLS